MRSDFSKWLAEKIAEIPCTQIEFSRRIEVSYHTLSSWLKGRGGIRADHVTRIARGLSVERNEVQRRLEDSNASSAAA